MAREYSYSPISGSEIRLLHLQPGKQLRGHLVSYERSQAPAYIAISYCWGQLGERASIKILPNSISRAHEASGNGQQARSDRTTLPRSKSVIRATIDTLDRVTSKIKPFPSRITITPNLRAALKVLQAANAEVIWADAICINQVDDAEKSVQVADMITVYQNAQRTLVWLDPRDVNLGVFARLQQVFQDAEICNTTINEAQLSLGEHETTALATVYASPWFSRLWCLQEVAASLHVVVACGNKAMPWSEFAYVTMQLVRNDLESAVPVRYEYMQQAISMVLASERYSKIDGALDIELLIRASALLNCTDPRDHWFSIYSMVALRSIRLAPDYTKPIVDVFTDVTTELICAGYTWSLEMTPLNDVYGLPSWVCDFTIQSRAFHIHKSRRAIVTRTPRPEIDGASLMLPMYIVDTISSWVPNTELLSNLPRGPYLRPGVTRSIVIDQVQERLKTIVPLEESASTYITGEDARDALLRTLVCNRDFEEEIPGPETLSNVEELLSKVHIGLKNIDFNSSDMRSMSAGFKLHSERTVDHKFVRSKRGFMGWTRSSVRPGDKICVVPCARLPLIFRGTDALKLIGPAYIHGLMDDMVDAASNVLPEKRDLVNSELRIMKVI